MWSEEEILREYDLLREEEADFYAPMLFLVLVRLHEDPAKIRRLIVDAYRRLEGDLSDDPR